MSKAKPIFTDEKCRLMLPKPVRPRSGWIPVLVSEKELRFVAYEGAKATELGGIVADTWEKLGPAPEIDYDKL